MTVSSGETADTVVRISGAVFDNEPGSIAAARLFTTAFCQSHHAPARLAQSAELVVSELVTNACKYAPGPILVELEAAAHALMITVWDSSPTVPYARSSDPGRIGQHGMEIVLALCDALTVDTHPVGKKVTARILHPDITPSV